MSRKNGPGPDKFGQGPIKSFAEVSRSESFHPLSLAGSSRDQRSIEQQTAKYCCSKRIALPFTFVAFACDNACHLPSPSHHGSQKLQIPLYLTSHLSPCTRNPLHSLRPPVTLPPPPPQLQPTLSEPKPPNPNPNPTRKAIRNLDPTPQTRLHPVRRRFRLAGPIRPRSRPRHLPMDVPAARIQAQPRKLLRHYPHSNQRQALPQRGDPPRRGPRRQL